MEATEEKRRRLGPWIVVSFIFFGLFLTPLRFGWKGEFWERFLDCGHVPVFALLTVFFAHQAPARWALGRRIVVAALVSAALGVGIEGLQYLTSRDASAGDMLNSAMGAFLGALWLALWPRGFGARFALTIYAAFVSAAIALPAWRQGGIIVWRETHFPLLADFESREEFRLWRGEFENQLSFGATIEPSTTGVAHGLRSARIFAPAGNAYPGVRLFLAGQDWTLYNTLAFEIYNPGTPFTVSLRVDDDFPARGLHDRFNRALPLVPGWNHLRIPLSEFRFGTEHRPLKVEAIRRILLFVEKPTEARVFYLDWMRLE